MNKDMICEPILHPQGKTIEQCIGKVPPRCINIVRGEDDLFPLEFVVEHEECSIDDLELIVPENVKDIRLWSPSVPDETDIIEQHPGYLADQTSIRLLIPS